jgi:ABC-type phosphate transport system permease subunit
LFWGYSSSITYCFGAAIYLSEIAKKRTVIYYTVNRTFGGIPSVVYGFLIGGYRALDLKVFFGLPVGESV